MGNVDVNIETGIDNTDISNDFVMMYAVFVILILIYQCQYQYHLFPMIFFIMAPAVYILTQRSISWP